MKTISTVILLLGCLITASCNTMINLAMSIPYRYEWEEVQSHGGIILGQPFKTNRVWRLPIECAAAGRFVAREPEQVTSFPLHYSGARLKREDTNLLMYLEIKGNEWGQDITSITLPRRIHDGTYNLYYLNRDSSRHFVQALNLTEPVKERK